MRGCSRQLATSQISSAYLTDATGLPRGIFLYPRRVRSRYLTESERAISGRMKRSSRTSRNYLADASGLPSRLSWSSSPKTFSRWHKSNKKNEGWQDRLAPVLGTKPCEFPKIANAGFQTNRQAIPKRRSEGAQRTGRQSTLTYFVESLSMQIA